LVDQLYGQTLAVARQGDLLYLGVGPCLQVFAINDLADFEPLGQCAPLPGLINDIVLVDDLAYIAAGDAGLQILDLATPIDPQPLAGLVKTLYSSSVAYSRIC
jgi:hypothetical protein